MAQGRKSTGPGGLYVTSLSNGALYRIIATDATTHMMSVAPVPEPGAALLVIVIGPLLRRSRRKRRG